MRKIKILLGVFLILLSMIFLVSRVESGYAPDKECYIGNYPNFVLFDQSYRLPSNGQFDGGTSGWTATTTAGATVNSYTTQGWVGLQCTAGSTASIECGPISVSMSTSTTGPQPSYDWDQIFMCIHFRGSTTYNSQMAGRFQVEFYDAASSQVYTALAYDASSSALNGYFPQVGLNRYGVADDSTWSDLLWSFTPPHQNWYRISQVKISYSVPTSGAYSIPTTEVQIDQLYIDTAWMDKTTHWTQY